MFISVDMPTKDWAKIEGAMIEFCAKNECGSCQLWDNSKPCIGWRFIRKLRGIMEVSGGNQ